MALIATASKTVRNKNLIMLVMFLGATGWFAYDGWISYPKNNDKLVAEMKVNATKGNGLNMDDLPLLEKWPANNGDGQGWNSASSELRDQVYNDIVKRKNVATGWKTQTDILVQKLLVGFLIFASGGVVWWYLHCQKRRVVADEKGLILNHVTEIPWGNITKIDNRDWKKKDIVTIEYKATGQAAGTEQGTTQTAILDGYNLDNLVPVLEVLAEKATNAEVLNPPEVTAES